MQETGLKVKISADSKELKKGMDDAKKQVKSFKERIEEAKKSVDEKFADMGESIKSAIKGTAVAVGAAAGALVALGASTTEYRNEQAKLVSAFESAGSNAEQAKDTYNDLFRVLGDSGKATEAASHLAKLTQEEQALNEWTTICQGVYAQFGDTLPVEALAEAVNHSSKLGSVQGNLADALEWSGVNVDEFNESLAACNTEAEREALIRQTLSGMYSESAANYEKNNAQVIAQNEAQARLQETTAKLGEKMQPVITAFTNFANDALAAVMPYITDLADKLMPKLQEVLGSAGDTISNILGFITDNWVLLVSIAGVIGGITLAIGLYNAVAAIKAAMAAAEVTTVWGLVSAYAAQAVAVLAAIAPYVLIVAAIAAVIAIVILCIKYWDEIKEFVVKVAKIIWGAVKDMADKIGKFFKDLWADIKQIFSNIGSWFGEKFTQAANGIKKAFSAIGSFFSNIWSDIKRIFSSVGTAIADAISNTVKGAINKVLSFATNTINGFIGAINTAIGIINAIPGVNIKKLSKLSVPQLAQGGIVDSATLAVIGEQGKEAVVPLENNTEWLDLLESRLNKGGNQPIILQVDGKTFAQIAVNSINDLTRVTGNLPLKLA